MKIVYLDQNKWIDLARSFHGKDADAHLAAALTSVRAASEQGSAVFPLSAIHYMEIARIRDPQRRARLGTVMWELSRGATIASNRAILIHELEEALARRFPHVRPRPFVLISKGVNHAFGMDRPEYRIPEPFRSQLPPKRVAHFERTARAVMEESLITGVGPNGTSAPPFGITSHNHIFKQHLENLYPTISQLPPEKWDDALHAISMVDITEPLHEVLQHQGVELADLAIDGKEALTRFMQDLPSRAVDIQLHRQVLRNPQLKPKITDLEDWGGLGPAAAHCDILVCEKHFANLLLRDGFRPSATIITDIRDLPQLL